LSYQELSDMKENILIIDSDIQELRRLRELLAKEGFNIMTATDHKTAKELCERIPIKLIIAQTDVLGFPNSK